MASATVRVRGLRELNRAFRNIDRKLAKQLGDELKEAAKPVVDTARDKVTRFQGASVSTIRSRRSGARVFVEQGARKVTGRRGDFGRLQMVTVLEPALDENVDEVVEQVDHVLARWGGEEGFG